MEGRLIIQVSNDRLPGISGKIRPIKKVRNPGPGTPGIAKIIPQHVVTNPSFIRMSVNPAKLTPNEDDSLDHRPK